MNKKKLLIGAVVVLLFLNLFLIGSMFLKNNHRHFPHKMRGRDEPKNRIIEILSFDQKQIVEYESLILVHRVQIEKYDEKIKKLKSKLYENLKTERFELKDSIINEINIIQKKIEILHFNHFVDIKNICNENQMDDFNNLSEKLKDMFSKRLPPRRH